jgi:Na+/H+ antiporter NhaC
MVDDSEKRPSETVLEDSRQLSVGAWIALVVMIGLLVTAITGVSLSGTDDLPSGMSGAGTIAMIVGGLFTIVVGGGLMGLIFYSSRHGYDDSPTVESTEGGRQN